MRRVKTRDWLAISDADRGAVVTEDEVAALPGSVQRYLWFMRGDPDALEVKSEHEGGHGVGSPGRLRGGGSRCGRQQLRIQYVLTAMTAVAMAVVSAAGAFAPQWLYRDNPLITATFRGQDSVTLTVAVPLLVVGLFLERRGSGRGRLVWLGKLFYAMYGYLFYAVGAAFNVFFLLYVAIFGLALYALVLAVPRIDITALAARLRGRGKAARGVAIGYMVVVAASLGLLWSGISISYLFRAWFPPRSWRPGTPPAWSSPSTSSLWSHRC